MSEEKPKEMELVVKGELEEKFVVGYNNEKDPTVAYITVPLTRILAEGRFGQVIFIGQVEVFKREVEHVLGMLNAKKEQSSILRVH